MDPPSTILCDMHPYQKQAHGWMGKLENGEEMEKETKTLYPCWNSCQITVEYDLIFLLYLSMKLRFPALFI